VFAAISKREDVEYRALVLNLKGIERAYAAGLHKAKLTMSASQSHQKANSNRSKEETFTGFAAIAEFAAAHGMELSGAIATSFGCPFEGEISVDTIADIAARYRDIGVRELSMSDTTGMADPKLVYRNCTLMRERFPEITWNLHFHNTRGMGLANVLAGMQAGINRFDAALGGLGGCPFAPGASGNIATEDVLHMLLLMGVETGVDIDAVLAAARRLREFVGHDLPSALLKAGKNSDLHQLILQKN
jgi:hydroxymethylglutaryl-CoA lyase